MPHRHKIPAVIEPIDDISICLPLPNHPDYIAAFLFAVKQMTLDRYWQHTPDLAAITVRNVMLNRTFKPLLDRLALLEGCGEVDCLDVADCIETSTDVQDALTNNNDQYGTMNPDYVSNEGTESTTIIDNRFPDTQRETEIKEAPADCDLDEIWSGIYFLVTKLDERGRDWLEQIVARVDKWERASEFVGTVPIVGELAEDLLLTFIDVVPDLLEFYNAWSSEEHLQDIACALFELVCAECRYPTYNEVLNYYASLGMDELSDWAIKGVRLMVDYMVGSSTFASDIIYHTIITFQLWVLYTQSTFFGLRGTKWLGIWLDNGEEFANDEWEVLCDGCANQVWCYEWDFTTSNGNFALHNPFGTAAGVWTDGIGWVFEDKSVSGFQYRAITLKTNTFASILSNITEWLWEGDYEFGHFDVFNVNPATTAMIAMRNSNNGVLYETLVPDADVPSFSGSPIEHTYNGLKSQTGTYFWFAWYASNDNQNPVTVDGTVTIRKLRVKGTGTMPAFTGGVEC